MMPTAHRTRMMDPLGKKQVSSSDDATRMSVRRRKLIGNGYEKRAEIGRGTYGTVYDGIHGDTQRRVAIKKVVGKRAAGEAEAASLRKCEGAKHVVQMLDVVDHNEKVYLILEFMDTDLETIVKATDDLPELGVHHVKGFVLELLRGVKELHDRHLLHRDLKPNNLLLAKDDRVLKITDFGMATEVDTTDMTRTKSIQVVTRAYRAPELFFGEDKYGFEVDVWSVGCIFAEMLLRQPYFDGSSDIDQLSLIFTALGSPMENGWDDAASLPFYLKFKDTTPTPLATQFPQLSTAGVNLLSKLLQVDPKKRITVDEALAHPFFSEEPAPAAGQDLPFVRPPDPKKKRPLGEMFAAAAAEEDEGDGLAIKGRRIL